MLVSALILIRRDLGMVKVGGGGGPVGGGRGIDVGSLLASEMWLRISQIRLNSGLEFSSRGPPTRILSELFIGHFFTDIFHQLKFDVLLFFKLMHQSVDLGHLHWQEDRGLSQRYQRSFRPRVQTVFVS